MSPNRVKLLYRSLLLSQAQTVTNYDMFVAIRMSRSKVTRFQTNGYIYLVVTREKIDTYIIVISWILGSIVKTLFTRKKRSTEYSHESTIGKSIIACKLNRSGRRQHPTPLFLKARVPILPSVAFLAASVDPRIAPLVLRSWAPCFESLAECRVNLITLKVKMTDTVVEQISLLDSCVMQNLRD